jgi:hypothetical protein
MSPVTDHGPDADAEAVTVQIAATHLYPGVRLSVPARAPAAPLAGLGAVRIVFSDGHQASGEFLRDSGGWMLAVAAHTTRAGTALAARLWPVRTPVTLDGPLARVRLGRALPGADRPGIAEKR